jgi:hypothetical protein
MRWEESVGKKAATRVAFFPYPTKSSIGVKPDAGRTKSGSTHQSHLVVRAESCPHTRKHAIDQDDGIQDDGNSDIPPGGGAE